MVWDMVNVLKFRTLKIIIFHQYASEMPFKWRANDAPLSDIWILSPLKKEKRKKELLPELHHL